MERIWRKNEKEIRTKKIMYPHLPDGDRSGYGADFYHPIVLTISNSFMSAAEITSNYGSIFQKTDTGGKQYISQTVNLKFIPDMVTFSQYATVLFKSPDYLLKFWNSVILVVPIVVFQLVVAVLATYGFTRTRGKLSAIVFFAYVILMMMPYQVTLVPIIWS